MNSRTYRLPIVLATALLVIATGAAATGSPSPASAPFNPAAIPVSTKQLPAFPYLDTPERLKYPKPREKQFDRAYFVAGSSLHSAEGHVYRLDYWLKDAGMSKLEALRNYEHAIAALGGVRVDKIHPRDKAFIAANGGDRRDVVSRKLGIGELRFDYASYLVRTAEKQVWIAIAIGNQTAGVTVLEEKGMEQTVGLTKADEMKAALDKDGYIALYINFDTDKAALRDDGKPAVDEITKLLKANPGLKLSVEGHTDNTGDAKRNKALSEQRAATIVTALKGAGIDGSRLKSAGFGADRPVADNRTEEGRAKNRRVELVKL